MKSFLLQDKTHIQLIQKFRQQLPDRLKVTDFEERIQLDSIRATLRLWEHNKKLIGFALVDHYHNLCFEINPAYYTTQLEQEIVAWGVKCMQERNTKTGKQNTLDACTSSKNHQQIDMLEKFNFTRTPIRTLSYERSLDKPIPDYNLPAGFSIRHVTGEQEVNNLVALHQAAFGTKNMTQAERLAIMRAPNYDQTLDLVVIAPNKELVGFCICSLENNEKIKRIGFTDPIGVHPHYQQRGIGKAIMTNGLQTLKDRGAITIKLGTSSENISMQHVAESLGFVCVSDKLWFSKKIT